MPWGDAIGGLIEALAPLVELPGFPDGRGRGKEYIAPRWPKIVLPILVLVAIVICIMAC